MFVCVPQTAVAREFTDDTHTRGLGGRKASAGGSREPGLGDGEAPSAGASWGLCRQERGAQPRPRLARGRQRRSAPLPRGEMKIIIIPQTFRFRPKVLFQERTLKERHRTYGPGDAELRPPCDLGGETAKGLLEEFFGF